jgi:hypothetical protein
VHEGVYLLIPFLLLYTLGFAAVAGLSLSEIFQGIRSRYAQGWTRVQEQA